MKIYTNCSVCGVNGVYIARIRKSHPDVEVINSRMEKLTDEHIQYCKRAGIAGTPPIVVEGNEITRLSEWKP